MQVEPFTSIFSSPWLLALIGAGLCGAVTEWVIPKVMRRTREAGFVGRDVNKPYEHHVPEMGGIAVLIGVSVGISLTSGGAVLFDAMDDAGPVIALLGTMFIASYIGMIDDIALVSRRGKAISIMAAGLPLAVMRPVAPEIVVPFLGSYTITVYWSYLLFWIGVVPFGVTAAANALNMSAGYNGLEPGETAIISFFLLIISLVTGRGLLPALIFGSLLGAAVVLYRWNRFPAKVFVGDVGTLSMGAMIGAGTIISGLEVFGVILFLPIFYELAATIYYAHVKGVERREACMNPVIRRGRLIPPEGAEYYTLAYFLLGRRPMTEKQLVLLIHSLFVGCGIIALLLALFAV